MAHTLLIIVGQSGEPIYELDASSNKMEDSQHLNQFIAHSALDLVEHTAWTTNSTSLRCVDKFQDKFVSAFVTPSNCKFLLIHDGRNEENIRIFFVEIHELFIKLMMNPFTEVDAPIVSTFFDKRARVLAKRL